MGRLREERSLVRGGDGRVCWRAAGGEGMLWCSAMRGDGWC